MREFIAAGCVVVSLCVSSVSQAQHAAEPVAQENECGKLKIKIASVFVNDQEQALKFYTEVLGFVKKSDVPVGEFRWLTVVSAEEPDGTELLLEPNANPAAQSYQKAIYDQGIPATTFFVEDVQKEYNRLAKVGVKFTTEPEKVGSIVIAVFDDTCGNLIQITQE